MKLRDIFDFDNPETLLLELLNILHKEGPVDSSVLEMLSYFKKYHCDLFEKYESRVIALLGLFYKNPNPLDSIFSLGLSAFGINNYARYGAYLTPVQSGIRSAIENNKYISISAPTSAGKSYSIREYIYQSQKDSVIVVPSRALIAEYVSMVKRRFQDDKNIMVSSFVDDVYKDRKLRHIFILTPERTRDLLRDSNRFDIDLFFFDEAQLSEDNTRGVVFDSLVRRILERFSKSKIIFAHPFIDNPGAQFSKHSIDGKESFSRSYEHGAVGKIFVFKHSNGRYYQYSPYENRGHVLSRAVEYLGDFSSFAFSEEKTVLVYVAKASIYSGEAINRYKKYIDKFKSIQDEDYLSTVGDIEYLIGADEAGRISDLVSLLKIGVVIHHGSVPLEVRFLIEDLVRTGKVRICFATSTLSQGVNMPFDIVWLDSLRMQGNDDEDRALSLKNLIGRAGRLTPNNSFDYGYVYTKRPSELATKISSRYKLNESSILESDDVLANVDYGEYVGAIQSGDFDYEYDIPITKLERLKTNDVYNACREIVELLTKNEDLGFVFKGQKNKVNRDRLKELLYFIYTSYLGRELKGGEKLIFSQAVMIFILQIRGMKFREIVGLRYSMITEGNGMVGFVQQAYSLPNSSLESGFPLFRDTDKREVSYDRIVYDTYDYLDKVVSFSLSEPFMIALDLYSHDSGDTRVDRVIDFFKYGTNDDVGVWLIRYGFPPEDIWDIKKYVLNIDENKIEFHDSIHMAPGYIRKMVEWYI